MPRSENLRTDNLHVEIRNKFLKHDKSRQVVQELDRTLGGSNERRVESWIQNMLAQKSGPKRALSVLYDDGSAKDFLKLLETIEGQADDARDFNALRHEKISFLASLDNQGDRYYTGDLRTRDGKIKANLGQVRLTALGKMQLATNGNGALEIALRNQTAKSWIEDLVRMEGDEKLLRDEYNKELVCVREVSADQYNCQLELLKSQGKDEQSARGMLRGSSKHFYQGLLQPADVKSGVDAVLVARGRLSCEDAKLCGVKREHEASVDKKELKRLRNTVKNVGAEGTRILHSRMYDMRFQATQLMMNDPTMKPDEAAKIVRQQCIDNKTYLFRDKDNNPMSAESHCKIYFDKVRDKEAKRVEMRNATESAALVLDGPASSSSDEEMMPGPSSCIDSSLQSRSGAASSASSASPPRQMEQQAVEEDDFDVDIIDGAGGNQKHSIRQSKKPRAPAPRRSKKPRAPSPHANGQGGGIRQEKEYVKLVVDKGFWGKLPTFVQIAKVSLHVSLLICISEFADKDSILQCLAEEEAGIRFRRQHNITYVATAEELLEWWNEDQPGTPSKSIKYQLRNHAELRLEP